MSPDHFWNAETPWHLHALMDAHQRANDPKRAERARKEQRKKQVGPGDGAAFMAALKR